MAQVDGEGTVPVEEQVTIKDLLKGILVQLGVPGAAGSKVVA
jgi:hypothetical protein